MSMLGWDEQLGQQWMMRGGISQQQLLADPTPTAPPPPHALSPSPKAAFCSDPPPDSVDSFWAIAEGQLAFPLRRPTTLLLGLGWGCLTCPCLTLVILPWHSPSRERSSKAPLYCIHWQKHRVSMTLEGTLTVSVPSFLKCKSCH